MSQPSSAGFPADRIPAKRANGSRRTTGKQKRGILNSRGVRVIYRQRPKLSNRHRQDLMGGKSHGAVGPQAGAAGKRSGEDGGSSPGAMLLLAQALLLQHVNDSPGD